MFIFFENPLNKNILYMYARKINFLYAFFTLYHPTRQYCQIKYYIFLLFFKIQSTKFIYFFPFSSPKKIGFSAVIPGYPRYSVLGDRVQGVYNLKVSNASLEDDAEYQCQIGPAKFNNAIRANAKLTVICEYILLLNYII